MRVAVAITTIKRSTQYVADTVASMRTDPLADGMTIALCEGSPEPVEHVDGVEVLRTSEETWAAWNGDHGGYKLTRNLLRAHKWLARQDADVFVFAEDDIVCAEGWLTRANAIVGAARKRHDRFALCCCSSHPSWCFGASTEVGSDAYAQFMNPVLFWGNQLLVYPNQPTVEAMASHIQTCVAKWSRRWPGKIDAVDTLLFGDQTTKSFFAQTKCPLFVTIPSLAKHVGKENTWSVPGAISVAFRDHPTARWK